MKYRLKIPGKVARKNEHVYFVPANFPWLCMYDIVTETVNIIVRMPGCGEEFFDCYFDGDMLWCASLHSGVVVKIDSKFATQVFERQPRTRVALSTYMCEGGIWIFPRDSADDIEYFDFASKAYTRLKIGAEDTTQCKRYVAAYCESNDIVLVSRNDCIIYYVDVKTARETQEVLCSDCRIQSFDSYKEGKYYLVQRDAVNELLIANGAKMRELSLPLKNGDYYPRLLVEEDIFIAYGEEFFVFDRKSHKMKTSLKIDSSYISGSLFRQYVRAENTIHFFPLNANKGVSYNLETNAYSLFDMYIDVSINLIERPYFFEGEIELVDYLGSVTNDNKSN
ncbi:MAG: hypothetical protein KBT19_03580 [Lachnospiraceae bacterium]|nr:hypothetical protein [Candidatus Colinaster equi]